MKESFSFKEEVWSVGTCDSLGNIFTSGFELDELTSAVNVLSFNFLNPRWMIGGRCLNRKDFLRTLGSNYWRSLKLDGWLE